MSIPPKHLSTGSSNCFINPKILIYSYLPSRKLPSVNAIARQSNQPLNFKMYERTRKHKRNEAISKEKISLFLEGGNAIVPISSKQMKKEQSDSNFLKSYHHKGRSKHQRHFFKQRHTIKRQNEDQHTQKLEQSALFTFRNNEKNVVGARVRFQCKPPIVRNSHLYTTLQASFKKSNVITQRNSGSKSKLNGLSNFKSVLSEELPSNKPLLYLDAKQISSLRAQSFIVLQHPSKQIICGNYFKKVAQMASLTKIMTFYTIYQLSIALNLELHEQIIVISDQIQEITGTTAELVPGEEYTVEQLLYGLMLPSGNDAAIALAKWGGGLQENFGSKVDLLPERKFISLMNKEAKKLGLANSSFDNPHGLPNYKNTSNPLDLAVLISACLHISLFKQIIATKTYSYWVPNSSSNSKRQIIWENTNKLLRRPGFIGGKTGVTVTAGPCLATCYHSNKQNKTFIVVLLRTSKLSRRFKETRYVLGWTLKRYQNGLCIDEAKKILRDDPVNDSDNSQDQQQFTYEKLDQAEIAKRNKILCNQL